MIDREKWEMIIWQIDMESEDEMDDNSEEEDESEEDSEKEEGDEKSYEEEEEESDKEEDTTNDGLSAFFLNTGSFPYAAIVMKISCRKIISAPLHLES